MTRAHVVDVTTVALGAVALLCAACSNPSHGRPFDFSRMRRQARYDTWTADRSSPTGGVMRTPPEHTRARDDTTFADDRRASVPAMPGADLAGGGRQYAISCSPCHGAAGFGGGAVSVNLVPWPAPPLRTARVAAMSTYDIYDVISNGATHMPPLAWQIPSRTRWAVAEWTRRISERGADSAGRADSAEAARVTEVMVRWREREARRRGSTTAAHEHR